MPCKLVCEIWGEAYNVSQSDEIIFMVPITRMICAIRQTRTMSMESEDIERAIAYAAKDSRKVTLSFASNQETRDCHEKARMATKEFCEDKKTAGHDLTTKRFKKEARILYEEVFARELANALAEIERAFMLEKAEFEKMITKSDKA